MNRDFIPQSAVVTLQFAFRNMPCLTLDGLIAIVVQLQLLSYGNDYKHRPFCRVFMLASEAQDLHKQIV